MTPHELQFDKATYEAAGSGVPCAACGQPLAGEYWEWQRQMLCSACATRADDAVKRAVAGASFGKALALGSVAALGCGIAYALFVTLTKFQLALATIGIAYVVARVVRHASGGLSGPQFQALAVGLTYVASSMGYFPYVEDLPMPDGVAGQLGAIAHLVGSMLVAPIVEIPRAPLGAFIVLFGLWEAWKLSRGVAPRLLGPFRLAPPGS